MTDQEFDRIGSGDRVFTIALNDNYPPVYVPVERFAVNRYMVKGKLSSGCITLEELLNHKEDYYLTRSEAQEEADFKNRMLDKLECGEVK